MIIQIDSREKKNDHVVKYLDEQEIKWVRSKLIVGDYMALENPLVVDLESMIWDKHNKGYDDNVPNDCADAFRYAVNTYYANPDSLWETPNAEEYFKIGE